MRLVLTERYLGNYSNVYSNVPLEGHNGCSNFFPLRPVSGNLKGGRTFRPELQGDSTDWTASVGPALQIEARVAGVDVGEDWLILVELRLCQQNKHMHISKLSCV